ncbi:type II secretion system GspH family protein [Flavobacteriales bacterium]|jgi:type IV pilus assembly protein PilE|nr:type II secretion system GspH family protein [Flavobacteriales bacterium]|tara:strand:- start:1131 stop:1529 length:399 start_codon:yes stop_codon:yes gene_type:complete
MNKKIKAFTLAELMIVLVIIGILVLLALPNLMPLISKAKSTEAKIHLEHIFNLEKSYFYLYSSYSEDLEAIGYQSEVSVLEGGNANYSLEILEATANAFTAQAVSLVDFDKDGKFNTWSINQDNQLVELIPD